VIITFIDIIEIFARIAMILPLLLVMAEICPLLSDKEALRFASTCKVFWTAISPVTLLEIEKKWISVKEIMQEISEKPTNGGIYNKWWKFTITNNNKKLYDIVFYGARCNVITTSMTKNLKIWWDGEIKGRVCNWNGTRTSWVFEVKKDRTEQFVRDFLYDNNDIAISHSDNIISQCPCMWRVAHEVRSARSDNCIKYGFLTSYNIDWL